MNFFYRTVFLFFLSSALLTFNSFSQSANTNIWYFGQNAGLDFNSGSPVALTNGMINTYEGCASVCNSSGVILFYTDGITVYNSSHNVMQNGSNLSGNSSSNQAAIIIPFPANPDLFYIFTTSYECSGPFAYSIVDMSLAGGLGAVTVKNNILLTIATEKLTAVKAANGTDFWVVVHQDNGNQF